LAHVASTHRAGALSAMLIGPQSELEPVHAMQHALNVQAPQALSATLALMGGFLFVLGWMNRRESHLAYFGALSMGWSVVEVRQWARNLPFDNTVSEFLLCALLPLLVLAGVQFLLRSAQFRHVWITRALALQCLVMPLSLMIAGPLRLYPLASFWYVLLAFQVIWAAGFYLRTRWLTQAFWWRWRWSIFHKSFSTARPSPNWFKWPCR
jgi:two-component system, NarL family, sensor histidine kinase UhpB